MRGEGAEEGEALEWHASVSRDDRARRDTRIVLTALDRSDPHVCFSSIVQHTHSHAVCTTYELLIFLASRDRQNRINDNRERTNPAGEGMFSGEGIFSGTHRENPRF